MRRLALLFLAAACTPADHWSRPLDSLSSVPLSVWESPQKHLYAVGGPLGSPGTPLFLRYDGSWRKSAVDGAFTLWWIFGFGEDDLYTVGEVGTILHYDGSTFTPETSGTDATLYGIWGTAADDLWAVGGHPNSDGVILHRDADGWHSVAVAENTGSFFKVWGSATDDVFVCGQEGTILHFDGSAWTAQDSGAGHSSLFTLAGRGPSEVYVVGGDGLPVALKYDGQKWSSVVDPVLEHASSLTGVSVATDGRVIFVGQDGTKLRGRPGALIDDSDQTPRTDLHGAIFVGNEIFAVGGNYNTPAGAQRIGVVDHFGGDISSTLR